MAPATYSSSGDRWTVGSEDPAGEGGSSVRDLTRDLLPDEDLPVAPLPGPCVFSDEKGDGTGANDHGQDQNEADGEDNENDNGDERPGARTGRRKKPRANDRPAVEKGACGGETAKDAGEETGRSDRVQDDENDNENDEINDDDDNDDDDESVEMKGAAAPPHTDGNGGGEDDENEDDDRTVSMTDDEDDRTVAMSVATAGNAGGEDDEDDRTVALGDASVAAPPGPTEGGAGVPGSVSVAASASASEEGPAGPGEGTGATTTGGEDSGSESELEFEAADQESDGDGDSETETETETEKNTEDSAAGDEEPPASKDGGRESPAREEAPGPAGASTGAAAPLGKPRDPGPEPTAPTPQRRSGRARKPRVPYSEEPRAPKPAPRKKPQAAPSGQGLPKTRDWVTATDVLFVHTEDKASVTVKQIFSSLEEQFGCKITKALKAVVRDRLRALVTGAVRPSVGDSDDEGGESHSGADPSLSSSSEPESSEDDADDEASDYSDSEGEAPGKKAGKAASSGNRAKKKQKKKRGAEEPTRGRSGGPLPRATARVAEAHRLRRKKRAEELRVRNEEMQLDQTKEDEERMEAIAALFETNTEELRLKRLEDRLDLLQMLDQKRLSVVAPPGKEAGAQAEDAAGAKPRVLAAASTGADDQGGTRTEPAPGEAAVEASVLDQTREAASASESDSSSSSEESSSDEEDLVIVGRKKPFKPLEPLQNNLPSRSLRLLDEVASPGRGSKTTSLHRPHASVSNATVSTPAAANPFTGATKAGKKKADASAGLLSPNRSMGARFALRNALKRKQIKQGNQWLARELGYKTEADHLKDCQTVADQKRALVVKLEQERLRANERRQLKERLLLQEQQAYGSSGEQDPDGDPGDEDYVPPGEENTPPPGEEDEDEDEEQKLAKEIEEEAREQKAASDTEADAEPETQPLETQPPLDPADGMPAGAATETGRSGPESRDGKPPESPKEIPLDTQPSLVENNGEAMVSAEKPSESSEEPKPDANQARPGSEDSDPIKDTQTTTQTGPTRTLEEGVVTPEKKDSNSDDEGELEFDATDEAKDEPSRPKNAGWQAMLKREAEKIKKQKKRKGGLVEEEAEEEEEEEIAGLQDFGFSIGKKNKKPEEEEAPDDLDADDLEHVVDDVSDGEGDEDAGMAARKRLEQKEEKARHKEILRRMREGYDGRRGGIAGGGAGARGMHRFDQLVAADNREDARRLGLLNDDELDSEDEKNEGEQAGGGDDEEDDEAALLDKMLKDRFMHRSSVELEENFSEDEEEEEEDEGETAEKPNEVHDEEVRRQERLAKRFAKRARMQRLEEMYGDSQEFSQQRLIDEDLGMKEELSQMRCGLIRRSSSLSRRSSSSSVGSGSNLWPLSRKRQRSSESSHSNSNSHSHSSSSASSSRAGATGGGSLFRKTPGSLSIALRANKLRRGSSFFGGNRAGATNGSGDHGPLPNGFSRSASESSNSQLGKRKQGQSTSGSLFSQVSGRFR